MIKEGVIKHGINKKGKSYFTLLFNNGKSMSIHKSFNLTKDVHDKKCKVDLVNGQIVKINVEGKEYIKQFNENLKKLDNGIQTTNFRKEAKFKLARAPYNFIPLQDVVIYCDKFKEKLKLNSYDKNLFTGYIDCEIITKTPLFIKGNESEFFSPNGQIKIPGSSIRGMIRNLVEIVTYSKFQFFDNKLLFYRGLADKSNLKDEYNNNMTSNDRKQKGRYKFNAGYLCRNGINYYIKPALKENGKQFSQVDYKFEEEFTYKKLKDSEYLVIPGKIKRNDKYSKNWLINPKDDEAEKIYISKEDIEQYKNDLGRYKDKDKDDHKKRDGDLLRMLEISKDRMVPCFYVKWIDEKGKERISFGHTGFFRLAYRKTIGDHVPKHLWNDDKDDRIDMTEAIFGREGSHAGRVQFEDAIICSDKNNIYMDEVEVNLAEPKPTSFQLYLEQGNFNKNYLKNMKHWNNETKIRGYKQYWHRNITSYNLKRSTKLLKKTNIGTTMKPIKENTKFKGRIRFQNLTKEELGALLFVLELPKNHYHKLGMGKPLGLGSIEIKPLLYLCDRYSRYQKLFDNNKWHLAEDIKNNDEFKNAFEKYILDKLKELNRCDKSAKSLWEIERLKELKVMLNWENTKINGWINKTSYMEIEKSENGKNVNEFRERPILVKPSEVIRN